MLRRTITSALILSAWAWSTLLVVGGAALAVSPPGATPWSPLSVALAGLAGIAAGVFVFEVRVADRLFPRAPASLTTRVQIAAGALMVVLAGAAVVSFIALG